MRRILSCLCIIFMIFLCIGCSNTEEPEPLEEEKIPIPEWMTDIHNAYDEVVKENNLDFSLEEIEARKDGNGDRSYSFDLITTNSDGETVDIGPTWNESDSENNGELKRSFCINLVDDIDNSILKEFMACTIAVVDKQHNYAKAKKVVRTLISSFDGYSQSKKIIVGDYKVYIKPTENVTLLTDTFEVVYLKEQNTKVNTKEYEDYSNDEMIAPLNEGEKVHLRGLVVSDVDLEFKNVLLVVSDKGKYAVYYDSEKFAGLFTINKEYDFYGVISADWKGYDGAITLDYVK